MSKKLPVTEPEEDLNKPVSTAAKSPAIDVALVLDVAATLFAEHGFEGTSTREIAKLSHCRLPSIYYHFNNKENLYIEAFTYKIEDTVDTIRRRVDVESSPAERMKALVAAFFELFCKDRVLMLLVQRDIAQASLPNRQFLCREQHEYFLRFIRDLISEVIGKKADSHLVFIINAMLLGYCEFYQLVREAGRTLPGFSDEERVASLQASVMKLLD